MDIWQNLKNESRPILLYGTGNGADKILDELLRVGVKVSGVFASDGFVRNRSFRGFEVISFSEAEARFGQFVALFSFGSNRSEVFENIRKIMSRQTLLCADVAVYGKEIFNLEFAKKHKSELKFVYSRLADEQSKKVFEQTVMFHLDGDINRLFCCETSEDEAFENILKLPKNSSFLDLGAYNGDTVLDFVRRCPNFSHITALEPDKKSFAKLIKNTEGISLTPINCAVSDTLGKIPFSFTASRGSSLGGEGEIESITIDSLGRDFDYIKFDVEGNEAAAIRGGSRTLLKSKPKMLISCYHRADDYFTIPLEVLKIRDDYKIYMRHYPYVPAWDTNFYFV